MIYIAIKDLLKAKNKSKYWFIMQMQGDYKAITKLLENETTSIRFETLEKACRIINCKPEDIIKLRD